MPSESLRLKIQLLIDPLKKDLLLKESNYTNFWYCLDTNKLELVEQLKKDICLKIFISNLTDYRSLSIQIDNFEVPSFETTQIFRDNDTIQISLKTASHLKADLTELVKDKTIQIVKPFEAALIGTSMVKHLDPNKIFENKKSFFKSISGGRISDIQEFIKKREGFFNDCQFICLTCGSNDCDSYNDIQTTIQKCLDLATYLHSKYPKGILIFNELIPRLKTKYIDLDFLKLVVPCQVVKHDEFEDKSKLENLLMDGVHINPINGVPIYIQDIKKCMDSGN
ncbi:hypothetical protein BpHYR1_002977 [Brachionus plicatilis]|uniref:Uncharacterized protein n=1 Tax=Brachionus plicatilis TaxID=10195 RepID=A0A3M7RU87_BRAPC|nr:hypothetical protein BpHYR1_002977 [Brachionus plicatilis]